MIEAIQPIERLWRMVKTWRLWVGPEGYENRYSHLADTLEEALTAHSELAAAREREAGLLALVERLRESIDRIMTGGNHLASALIGILGAGEDTFPLFTTPHEKAREIIKDADHYDLWCCWKVLMEERSVLMLPPPAALEALRRREREAALLEAANLIRQTTPDATDDEFSKGKYDGRIYAIEQIESMADAIAAERGQENK